MVAVGAWTQRVVLEGAAAERLLEFGVPAMASVFRPGFGTVQAEEARRPAARGVLADQLAVEGAGPATRAAPARVDAGEPVRRVLRYFGRRGGVGVDVGQHAQEARD